jgi:hypothetical protein
MRLISAESLVRVQSPPLPLFGIDIVPLRHILSQGVMYRSFSRMTLWPFNTKHIHTVDDALGIAEESTGDFFKFSFGQWKRLRYEVKTLSDLHESQIVYGAFALLEKGFKTIAKPDPGRAAADSYIICLQDHHILEALKRDKELGLLPLLVYIFTHELVHIVRFCNFSQRFEITGKERDKEERIVHATTYEILKDLSLNKMHYILESYENHRVCDLATC